MLSKEVFPKMKVIAGALALIALAPVTPLLAQETDLTVYIGHHPAKQVDGMAFIDDPSVRSIVEKALDDQSLRDLVLKQTRDRAFATYIFESQDKIYFKAYDPTHGSTDNWGISISPDGENGAVCVAVGGSGDLSPPGNWYREGGVVAISEDGCPIDAAGLAFAFGG